MNTMKKHRIDLNNAVEELNKHWNELMKKEEYEFMKKYHNNELREKKLERILK